LQHLQHLTRFVIVWRKAQDDQVGPAVADRDIRRRVSVEKVHAEAVGAEQGLDAHESFRTRANDQGSRHYAAGGRCLDGLHVSLSCPGINTFNVPDGIVDFPTKAGCCDRNK
jgi:hypothetical protein